MTPPETFSRLHVYVGHTGGGCGDVATIKLLPGYSLIADEDLAKLQQAADELGQLKARLALAKQLANNIVADLAGVAT